MSVIEWRREPRRVLLPVLILAPYPATNFIGQRANALLDTGSSVSGVALGLAKALNLQPLGKRPLKSAQGEGQIERYAFRIGLQSEVAPSATPLFPFIFEEVIGIELTNAFEFNALIGMDILHQCDLEMRRDGICRLHFGY